MDHTKPPKEILYKILDLLYQSKDDIMSSDEVDFHRENLNKYKCQMKTGEDTMNEEKVKEIILTLLQECHTTLHHYSVILFYEKKKAFKPHIERLKTELDRYTRLIRSVENSKGKDIQEVMKKLEIIFRGGK
jgi:hypothetical protein